MQIIRRTEPLTVIGWPLRTSNERAFEDIPSHWGRFSAAGGLAAFAQRLGDDVFAVYTGFEHEAVDNHGLYTLVIGTAVAEAAPLPPGMVRAQIRPGREAVFDVEAGHPEKVGEGWREVWARDDIEKAYVADHEHYRPDGRIAIHVGIR